jgi:AcrR family transcriptional regulator
VLPVDDTPARLVAAFTELIADGGEEAISLRAVSRAARSNAAAVHYHFGGRDELLAAVIGALVEPVQQRRFALLDEARARHGDPVPPAALALALVRPDLELLAGLSPDRVRVARLLGQPAAPASAVAAVLDRQFAALASKVLPMLDPAVSTDELQQRLRWVLAASASVLATAGTSDEPDEARLVSFCAAGLAAAPTRVPRSPDRPRTKAGTKAPDVPRAKAPDVPRTKAPDVPRTKAKPKKRRKPA